MCNPRKIKSYNKTLYVGGNTISKSDKKGATYNILRIYKIEKRKMVNKISLVDNRSINFIECIWYNCIII